MTDNGLSPHVLRDHYAFLGDGYRGALVAPRGDVSWMWAPAWDSPAVFARVVGGRGGYAVTPRDTVVSGGYYEPRSLVWRNAWGTTSDHAECREALAAPSEPHRLVLPRRVEAVDGDVGLDVTLQLGADFARADSRVSRGEDGTWLVQTGDLKARWSGGSGARLDKRGQLHLPLDLGDGHSHDLVRGAAGRLRTTGAAVGGVRRPAAAAAGQRAASVRPRPADRLRRVSGHHRIRHRRSLTSDKGTTIECASTTPNEESHVHGQ